MAKYWRLLGCFGLLLLAINSYGAAVLKNLDYNVVNDGQTQIIAHFNAPIIKPKTFDTMTPPRIVIDFLNTENGLKQNDFVVEKGLITSMNVTATTHRLRLLLNLEKMATYNIECLDDKTIVINLYRDKLANPARVKQEMFVSRISNPGEHMITDINFKRNEGGGGQVIIKLSDPRMGIDVTEQSNNVMVNFLNTDIPPKLQRQYDVTEFGTPVKMVIARREGSTSNILIHINGDYAQTSYQVNNRFVINIMPLTPAEKAKMQAEQPKFTGKRLSLDFQNISVRAVLQLLADFTGINIVASDSVKGTITLRLNDVPWDEALNIILRTQVLAQKQMGNVIWIAPAAEMAANEKQILENQRQFIELAPLQMVSIHLKYAKAVKIAALLKDQANSLLTTRGNVTIDERTNTIFIRDIAENIAQIRKLIDEIDVSVRQVMIEARIVNIDTTFEQDLGIRWGITKLQHVSGTLTGADLIQQNIINGNPPLQNVPFADRLNVNLPAAIASVAQTPSLGIALANLGKGYLLDLELSAIESEGGGQLIASPRLVTQDQHIASIEQGQEIPYQQATSSGATAVEFKKAVLSLEVVPQITPDGKVIMDIKVNQDNRDIAQPPILGVPAIDTRQIKTNVLVDNGETIVLGGIYQEENNHTIQRVPFLGTIPYLGALFRNTDTTSNKTELLIFITPKIIQQTTNI